MDFQTNDLQKQLRELTRKFAQNEIAPSITQDEADERFRPEWIQQLGNLGLTGIPVSEAYQGAGLGYQEYVVTIEELARVSAAYAISVAVTGLPQIILSQWGTEEQKKKYIPPLAQGKQIGSFSLSEAGSGSDSGALSTIATKEGSQYKINGSKLWVTQADVASVILLMARTGSPGNKGISTFIIDKDCPGLKMGKREKKMGLNTSHTMEILLDNVIVSESQRIGEEGDGFKIAMTTLDSGRITIAATALGLAKSALKSAKEHSIERKQFGKPIHQFQGISFLLADMKTQIDAAELMIYRAAWLKDQDSPYSLEASEAKVFATDMAMKVTTDAVQILGGSGYTCEFPVERYMREAKVLQIVEGTNQIQRMVISRHVIQNPEITQ